MKRISIIVLALITCSVAFAQGKFSASLTNTGNLITFKLRPDVTTTTGFSTIEFFVRYPASTSAFTYGAVTVNTAEFPGMAGNGTTGGGAAGSGAWEIERDNPAYSLPGFKVDHFIYTAPAVATTPAAYTGGVAYNLLTVELVGTPPNTVDLQFVSDDFESTYYLAITDQNGGDLRPSAVSDFFFPTTLSTPGPNGATIYFQELLNVPLPVKFLGFNVTKGNNVANLTWSVENEDANTASYEIERSLSGVDFTKVATVAPLNNGRSSNSYSYTQENLSAIRNSGVIYFRIKQIDRDGRATYTDIKSVRLAGKGLVFGVYPNPVKATANVTFDLGENTDVIIKLIDASGKQVAANQVQGFKGANIAKVNMANLASGTYTMSVQAGAEVKTATVVKISQ